MREKLITCGFFVIVVILNLITVKSLWHRGFPPSHDGEYHLIRFYEFTKNLQEGNLYPRWASDLNEGFGVPLFNYVYPLPNYIASFFHFVGFSFIDSFKLNLIAASLIGGVFFFLWSSQFWGGLGGLVSSVLYAFAPYRLLDIYIRGSIGEVWVLALLPGVLWLMGKRKNILLTGLLLSLIIFSHNILALMSIGFVILYGGLLSSLEKDKKRFFLTMIFSVFIAIGLSAIFWLPALWEKQYVRGLQIFFITEKSFPELYQFFFPSWGSGFMETNLADQMSFQIGIVNLLAIFLSLIALTFFIRQKKEEESRTIIFFLLTFLLVFLLMNPISLVVWQKIPLMAYFQFPWRFLSVEIIIAAFLAGSLFKIKPSLVLAVTMILISFLLSKDYLYPAYFHQRNDDYYLSRANFIEGTNSPGDLFNTIWFDNNLKKTKEKITVSDKKTIVKKIIESATEYQWFLSSEQDQEVIVNLAYFPGWKVWVNDREQIINYKDNGLIRFKVPSGDSLVRVKFQDTAIRIIAKGLSLSTLFLCFVWFMMGRRKEKR